MHCERVATIALSMALIMINCFLSGLFLPKLRLNIKKEVKAAGKRKNLDEVIDEITIEQCGKSRVHLGGLAETLHKRNLRSLHQQLYGE